ncbi:hypothetical protein JW758_03180 [Candidatus Peregrinibacteria bacterium]|nr:hypothetical protein [Candidatus Peregrinibacteria bacterium]
MKEKRYLKPETFRPIAEALKPDKSAMDYYFNDFTEGKQAVIRMFINQIIDLLEQNICLNESETQTLMDSIGIHVWNYYSYHNLSPFEKCLDKLTGDTPQDTLEHVSVLFDKVRQHARNRCKQCFNFKCNKHFVQKVLSPKHRKVR